MTNQQIEDYVNKTSYQDLSNYNPKQGRLHSVKKSVKEFSCRICSNIIPKGASCFKQNVYGDNIFPIQMRVCNLCSKKLIADGVEVVEK